MSVRSSQIVYYELVGRSATGFSSVLNQFTLICTVNLLPNFSFLKLSCKQDYNDIKPVLKKEGELQVGKNLMRGSSA
jgi:hypothetical protein